MDKMDHLGTSAAAGQRVRSATSQTQNITRWQLEMRGFLFYLKVVIECCIFKGCKEGMQVRALLANRNKELEKHAMSH